MIIQLRKIGGFFNTLIISIIALIFNFGVAYTEDQASNYYKNFVRHSDGSFCKHTPPTATFTAYLNHDQSKILVENAPRWDAGGVPNMEGNGTFGIELNNFINPSISEGDSVFIRFTCNDTHEQGLLTSEITSVPFYYFPTTLHLLPVEQHLPSTPQNLQLNINEKQQRTINWQMEENVTYSVYRRAVADTIPNGRSRMLYQKIITDLDTCCFTDTITNSNGHGYIIIPRSRDGIYGSHSKEISDYPDPPQSIAAAVTQIDPYQVAVTWQSPAGNWQDLHYFVYRDTIPEFPIITENILGKTNDIFLVDSSVNEGATYYYKVVAINRIGVKGSPSEEVSVTVQPPQNIAPNIDLLFISRSPKYPRFQVEYSPSGYNPHVKPGTEDQQHYPKIGEIMTYTAVIQNSGGQSIDEFEILWYVDSLLVKDERLGPLFPEQKVTSTYKKAWEEKPSYIQCRVQPTDSVLTEVSHNNNSITIRTNALSFHFHAEENIMELFGDHRNPMGSYSFEDWAQVHINQLNEFFREAKYPDITPKGVPEYMFLDTVSYYDNGELPAGGTHAPSNILWDGQWGFTGDEDALNYFENIVLGQNNGMDWALIHELGHQLGLIDLYNMDVQESELQVIEPRTGESPDMEPIAWDVLHYSSRSNYLMHTNFQNGFSDEHAGALLRNLGKRRGFYGEFLADIPKENILLIKKQNGTPVENATVSIYQQQDQIVSNTVKFSGITDNEGKFKFPDVTDSEYEGGMKVENPFSTKYSPDPNVVGTNAVLFIRVAKDEQVGYHFLDICAFNVAYWSGDTLSTTIPITIDQWQQIPVSKTENSESNVPDNYQLKQNYPNPFNSQTEIQYQLPQKSNVNITIYNALGEKITTLVNEDKKAGYYNIDWDGRNMNGREVPSGVYFIQMKTSEFESMNKLLFIK